MDGFKAMQMLSLLSTESEPDVNMLSFSSSSKPHRTISFKMSPTRDRSMHGPFTSAQWAELEHQALIYRYISSNVPVPISLLRRSLHLGWSRGSDPEPGRCRRTDGKKWRCSKDTVPDHKYCERHMNRGRQRSRKPVELLRKGSPVASSSPIVGESAREFGAVSSESLVNPSQKRSGSFDDRSMNVSPPQSPASEFRGDPVSSMGGPLGEALTNGNNLAFDLPVCSADSRNCITSSPISLW